MYWENPMYTKLQKRLTNLFLLIAVLTAATACGAIDVGIEPAAQPTAVIPTAVPTIAIEPTEAAPEMVQNAVDAALAYLRQSQNEAAPPENLDWTATYTGESGLVGAGKYQFLADDWLITVDYPIVNPADTIYDIVATQISTGVVWQGQVDAVGQVLGVSEDEPAQSVVTAVAWYGTVHSTPDGAQYDDYLALWPESLGQIGLEGAAPDVEAQIVALRDKEPPGHYAHFWGTLHCDVIDYGGCQLLVERLRPDGPGDFFAPDLVEGWEGTLTSIIREEPGSGGDDFFTLAGDWPLEYGIGSQDANVQTQLDDLRDSGTPFRIWGQLTAGVPDAGGVNIAVEHIEVVSSITEAAAGNGESAVKPSEISITDDTWFNYTNYQLGFSINYPRTMIHFFGSCQWNEENGDHSYRPELSYVPVTIFEDGKKVYISSEYYHELTGETRETSADGGTRTFYSECQAVTNNLDLLRDPDNHYQSKWEIVVAEVHNDEALDAFIQARYGSNCSSGEKTASAQEGVYDVKPLCPLNYGTIVKYYPAGNRVIAWDTGQAYTFAADASYSVTYDQAMIDSFEFITDAGVEDTSVITPANTVEAMADLISYTNDDFGFTFQYPANWALEEIPRQALDDGPGSPQWLAGAVVLTQGKLAISIQHVRISEPAAWDGGYGGGPYDEATYGDSLTLIGQDIYELIWNYNNGIKAIEVQAVNEDADLALTITLRDSNVEWIGDPAAETLSESAIAVFDQVLNSFSLTQ
jgi:hypothetical protein